MNSQDAFSHEFYTLPRIKLKNSQRTYGSFGELGKTLAKSNPFVVLGAGFSDLADRAYMSPGHCLVNFATKLAETRQAYGRSGWFGGRLYNRLTGESAEFVELTGTIVNVVHDYIGEPLPERLDGWMDVMLRLDFAENLYERFQEKARQEGLIE